MEKGIEAQSRFRKYIVDAKDFKIINRIGGGGFGIVYLVRNEKTGEKEAAKIIKKITSE